MIKEKIKNIFDSLATFLENSKLASSYQFLLKKIPAPYLLFARYVFPFFCLFLIFSYTGWKLHILKNQISEKRKMSYLLLNVKEEISLLKQRLPASKNTFESPALDSSKESALSPERSPWNQYFFSEGKKLGLTATHIFISRPTSGHPSPVLSDSIQESLYDIHLKHINIKQCLSYLHTLEMGTRPVKIRRILIDTQGEGNSGYLEATISLSIFSGESS